MSEMTPEQVVVLKAAVRGASWAEAAKIAGVTDRTVRRWRKRGGVFADAWSKASKAKVKAACPHVRKETAAEAAKFAQFAKRDIAKVGAYNQAHMTVSQRARFKSQVRWLLNQACDDLHNDLHINYWADRILETLDETHTQPVGPEFLPGDQFALDPPPVYPGPTPDTRHSYTTR